MLDGRKTKMPYDPVTSEWAASDNSATWATRGEAEFWALKNRGGGIGIMFSALEDGLLHLGGVDLDTCRDPETGALTSWAEEVLVRFETYAEISPSQTGVKLLFTFRLADLPEISRLVGGQNGRSFKDGNGEHPPSIELSISRRYFTVTDDSQMRQVSVEDIRWLVTEAGPRFACKNGNGRDSSRSAKAFRRMQELKAMGWSYPQCRDALLASPDPDIHAWANEKGLANGERELGRAYENAKGRYAAGQMNGSTVIVGGVPKWLTNFDELSEQFALLQAPGLPSVYISRPDVLPIQESDLKRRLESSVVQTGVDKDGRPVYLAAFKYWVGHARRHLYRRIVFTNRAVCDDCLNIYKRLGVTPEEGEISRILAHIREVICAGAERDSEAMLNLLAWQIQNVGRPSRNRTNSMGWLGKICIG